MSFMVGNNIKHFKESNKFTFRQLARKVNVNHTLLIKLANKNRTTVSLDVICRLSEGLDVKIDDLLFKNIYSN